MELSDERDKQLSRNVIRQIVQDTLSVSVATIQRRIAIQSGVRETDRASCVHQWDHVRRMCLNCGETQEHVFFSEDE